MVVNNTTEEILAAWRRTIEGDQEAGSTPLLTLGESTSLLDGLPSLVAYHELALSRTDLTSPFAQAGGSSALWFAMLSDPAPRAAMPLFSGADAASVMAQETLNADQVNSKQALPAKEVPGKLPAGFISHLEPTAIPGTTLHWSSLPFAVMNPAPAQNETASTDWAATAAVFLALCLILLALVI
jgi:hypothetical protein